MIGVCVGILLHMMILYIVHSQPEVRFVPKMDGPLAEKRLKNI